MVWIAQLTLLCLLSTEALAAPKPAPKPTPDYSELATQALDSSIGRLDLLVQSIHLL